ncbi:hypothetical protein YC2023_082622 [Brassica napus]|uniref:(rape) hypothetical protein n=1 Tax=Brassica napus TaxID=3708 RepID=A0A816LW15_BRANA|nr:unnamed protein product [Brassica napus]
MNLLLHQTNTDPFTPLSLFLFPTDSLALPPNRKSTGDDQEDPHFPSSASNKFSVDGFIMDGSIVDESFVDRCIMDGSIEDGWVVYGFIIDDLFLGNLKIDRCPHRLIRTDLSTQMLSTPSLWTITLRLHLLIHSIYMLCNILTERL